MKYVATILLIITSFILGWWIGNDSSDVKASMEDYALQNVLEALGYAHYLEKNDIQGAQELIDVNLSNHLQYVAKYQGANNANGFEEAKIRALNAASILWEDNPPNNLLKDQSELSKQGESIQVQNYELLEWAKKQCASNPGLECKAHNKAPQPMQ